MSNCRKLDECQKIEIIMDKDLAGDWQYAEAIRGVCALCKEREE